VISAKRSLRFARAGVEGRVLELERIGEGEGGPIGRSEVESWLSARRDQKMGQRTRWYDAY